MAFHSIQFSICKTGLYWKPWVATATAGPCQKFSMYCISRAPESEAGFLPVSVQARYIQKFTNWCRIRP